MRNATCDNVTPHGCFMTYLGGNGTMLYENITVKGTELIFRVDATAETGANAKPIDVHARNITLLNTTVNAGTGKIHWSGMEDNISRSSPRAMLILHDLFGSGFYAIVLPAKQSTTLQGVPAGLNFMDGGTVTDPRGLDFDRRRLSGFLAADGMTNHGC